MFLHKIQIITIELNNGQFCTEKRRKRQLNWVLHKINQAWAHYMTLHEKNKQADLSQNYWGLLAALTRLSSQPHHRQSCCFAPNEQHTAAVSSRQLILTSFQHQIVPATTNSIISLWMQDCKQSQQLKLTMYFASKVHTPRENCSTQASHEKKTHEQWVVTPLWKSPGEPLMCRQRASHSRNRDKSNTHSMKYSTRKLEHISWLAGPRPQ